MSGSNRIADEEMRSLVAYGAMVDVLVTPTTLDGRPAAAIRDNVYTDYYKAFSVLRSIQNEICAGQAA